MLIEYKYTEMEQIREEMRHYSNSSGGLMLQSMPTAPLSN